MTTEKPVTNAVEPPEMMPPVYACVNGHRIMSPLIMVYHENSEELTSVAVCPICYIEWIAAHVSGVTPMDMGEDEGDE